MRCQLRNTSYTLSTNIGGETSFGRPQLEGIVKRHRARPRILWKPIEREKGGIEMKKLCVRVVWTVRRAKNIFGGGGAVE